MRINEAYTCAYWCHRVGFEFHILSVNGHRANVCGCMRERNAKKTNVLPHNDIDGILAYTIFNECNAEAQQARFSPEFGFLLLCIAATVCGLRGTRHQQKMTTTTCSYNGNSDSDNGDCEKSSLHTYRMGDIHAIVFDFVIRANARVLFVMAHGACGKSKKEEMRKTHMQACNAEREMNKWAELMLWSRLSLVIVINFVQFGDLNSMMPIHD